MTTKKANIALIIGDNETYDEFCSELNRKSAVLDFLALYNEAKKDDVVQRVKHIIHATGFRQYKPKQWEMYITRLLGRCLRHIFAGYQAVEKDRNSFGYTISPGRGGDPQYNQILDMCRIVQLDWPWFPYGGDTARYRQNPQLYWKTRGIVDPADVDVLFAEWNNFQNRIDRYDRCQINSGRLNIRYGSSAYRRWHSHDSATGTYQAYEAYVHLKSWIVEADLFLERNHIFDTLALLKEHDRSNDPQIERELQENREQEVEIARGRATRLARERARLEVLATVVDEQQERELTLGENLFEKLRERGLVE